MTVTTPVPTIGRIVHYRLSAGEAAGINKARLAYAQRNDDNDLAFQTRSGSHVTVGDVVPLIITKVFPSGLINGQLILDGTDTYWVTSRTLGTIPGTWAWPVVK